MFDINTIICIFTIIVSFIAFSNAETRGKMLHIPYREDKYNEKSRMLFSGFIHGDIGHLLFNMIALYSFGSSVMSWFASPSMFGAFGTTAYLLFYLIAIVAANIPTYQKHKDNQYYAALGASGAIAAVIFAAIVHNPLTGIYLYFIPIPIPGFIFGALYLWYENYASKNMSDNIGHDAHFYGALFGILFVACYKPSALLNCLDIIVSTVQGYLT